MSLTLEACFAAPSCLTRAEWVPALEGHTRNLGKKQTWPGESQLLRFSCIA